jgi:hypothetical protein
MVRPARERLAGVVEVDESHLGGDMRGLHGRHIGGRRRLGWLRSENASPVSDL